MSDNHSSVLISHHCLMNLLCRLILGTWSIPSRYSIFLQFLFYDFLTTDTNIIRRFCRGVYKWTDNEIKPTQKIENQRQDGWRCSSSPYRRGVMGIWLSFIRRSSMFPWPMVQTSSQVLNTPVNIQTLGFSLPERELVECSNLPGLTRARKISFKGKTFWFSPMVLLTLTLLWESIRKISCRSVKVMVSWARLMATQWESTQILVGGIGGEGRFRGVLTERAGLGVLMRRAGSGLTICGCLSRRVIDFVWQVWEVGIWHEIGNWKLID